MAITKIEVILSTMSAQISREEGDATVSITVLSYASGVSSHAVLSIAETEKLIEFFGLAKGLL